MADYTFGDVLRYNNLARNELKRWTQIGLIDAGIAPGESRRRFSARNLVEAGVCDELRGFGMPEALLKDVVKALNERWDQPDWRSSMPPVIWISFQQFSYPPDDEVRETIMIRFVDLPTLTAILTTGSDALFRTTVDADFAKEDGVPETGVAVPLAAIIANLERRTGDRFDFTRQPVADTATPAAAQDLEHIQQTLTAKFTQALAAALTAATGDQPIGDEKRAAIISAVAAALKD